MIYDRRLWDPHVPRSVAPTGTARRQFKYLLANDMSARKFASVLICPSAAVKILERTRWVSKDMERQLFRVIQKRNVFLPHFEENV